MPPAEEWVAIARQLVSLPTGGGGRALPPPPSTRGGVPVSTVAGGTSCFRPRHAGRRPHTAADVPPDMTTFRLRRAVQPPGTGPPMSRRADRTDRQTRTVTIAPSVGSLA